MRINGTAHEKNSSFYKQRKKWLIAVTCLASVVVFCTTYALILPAITLEANGILDCYYTVHQHDKNCYDSEGNLICGYADYVVHTHDTEFCYDADGNLVCKLAELKEHKHDASCYQGKSVLTCGQEESAGHEHDSSCYISERGELICKEFHEHTDECYEWIDTLTCDLEVGEGAHQHTDDCYKAEEELTCGKEEVILHTHSDSCYDDDGNLICGQLQVEEHVHNLECIQTATQTEDTNTPEQPDTEQSSTDDSELTKADTTVVQEAVVWLTGEDTYSPTRVSRVMTLDANTTSDSGSIAEHLTAAQIQINGETYDGVSELNPGEQFTVALDWQLTRNELDDTLTYTYKLPEQINVKDVAETVLYDENNNRKGVYSITDGVLTVTYDNVADLNKTSFKLNATWNQDKIDQYTTVNWNDTLSTTVKFDNSKIAATKELLDYKTIEDGSFIAEYAVNVAASGAVENITLTDTLTSEKFHFCQGYYEINGEKYDYRYKIVGADGSETYQYANFPSGTFDANGNQLTDAIEFPEFNLSEGQTCTVEYAVKLDADDRFELDQNQNAAGLTNTATASYPAGDDTITSSVTVTDTYRAETKWVIKEQGKLGEGDVEQDTDVPWKVTVNPGRDYDMGGAVIGDSIQTKGVVYKIDSPITITSTTAESSATATPTWITLSDATVSLIQQAGGQAADQLFQSAGASVLAEIEKAVGDTVTKENISNYVFVGTSKQQFVWFTPETGTPTTYELSYITDISHAASAALTNSAAAGWKQWTAGVVVGSFIQEINIEKENDGVYQKGDDYFVDWTITLDVPADRNAIPNVFLYDALPYHNESGGYDWLAELNASEFDFAELQANQMSYLNEISKSAFEISTTSENESVQDVVNNATTSLGHPVTGLGSQDYKLYEKTDTLSGQLPIVNGGDAYSGKRVTPTRFGVCLGNLPATTGTDGYTITIKYTTQVDPKLVEGLNGRAYGNNTVGLMQRQGEIDVLLGRADASYWLDHATVENTLAKSVVDFDSKENVVTYQVNINPDASLDATSGGTYILRDVLNLPGASFIENSFKLSFQGSVSDNAEFSWDDEKETVLWRKDDGAVDLPGDLSAGMKDLVSLDVKNPENGSSKFEFSLRNADNVLALTEPEGFEGKLAPMTLTYQVQLPKGTEVPTQETITNSATFYVKPADGSEVLLDGVKTEFDYTSALHKWQSVAPNGDNGYTASFLINVDKKTDEWKNLGDTFTVSDDMSKSLVVDVTSIKVFGVKEDGGEEPLNSGYTSSYDDRTSESQNYLSITIKDSDQYVKYRIEYDAKIQGEAEQIVKYDNVASVEGTDIRSEEVEKDVYIQKQDGSVIETNYEVKLLKFDASNIAVKLEAAFTLYAWENDEWKVKLTGLTTDGNGELVLNNTRYKELGLGPDTWYKLEETNAPEGYLKSVTYFRIGQADISTKPDEIGSYTTIPLNGGTHQIPNYKASVRLHKTDADKGASTYLTGAQFALYDNLACSGTPLATATEERAGIYTFELSGLTAGTTYYLKETKAPEGYHLSDTVYTVTFDQEGNVTLKNGDVLVETDSSGAYLIANSRAYELPATGGVGTTLYTLGGLMIICAGLILLYIYKKRRKEDSASS